MSCNVFGPDVGFYSVGRKRIRFETSVTLDQCTAKVSRCGQMLSPALRSLSLFGFTAFSGPVWRLQSSYLTHDLTLLVRPVNCRSHNASAEMCPSDGGMLPFLITTPLVACSPILYSAHAAVVAFDTCDRASQPQFIFDHLSPTTRLYLILFRRLEHNQNPMVLRPKEISQTFNILNSFYLGLPPGQLTVLGIGKLSAAVSIASVLTSCVVGFVPSRHIRVL